MPDDASTTFLAPDPTATAMEIMERVKRGLPPPEPLLAHELAEREAHDRAMRAYASNYITMNVDYSEAEIRLKGA